MITTTFTDVVSAGLQGFCQMPPAAAADLARAIACAAARMGHSGTEYYLPALHTMTRAERNEAIRREFNGANLDEVRKKYGVGKTTVYRAVRRGE